MALSVEADGRRALSVRPDFPFVILEPASFSGASLHAVPSVSIRFAERTCPSVSVGIVAEAWLGACCSAVRVVSWAVESSEDRWPSRVVSAAACCSEDLVFFRPASGSKGLLVVMTA